MRSNLRAFTMTVICTSWEESEFAVFVVRIFPVFGLNTETYSVKFLALFAAFLNGHKHIRTKTVFVTAARAPDELKVNFTFLRILKTHRNILETHEKGKKKRQQKNPNHNKTKNKTKKKQQKNIKKNNLLSLNGNCDQSIIPWNGWIKRYMLTNLIHVLKHRTFVKPLFKWSLPFLCACTKGVATQGKCSTWI